MIILNKSARGEFCCLQSRFFSPEEDLVGFHGLIGDEEVADPTGSTHLSPRNQGKGFLITRCERRKSQSNGEHSWEFASL